MRRLVQAAHSLAKTGESLQAHETIQAILPRVGRTAECDVLEATASALHALKCHEAALSCARQAAKSGANDPAWTFFLATLEMFCGNVEQAESLLEQCLRERPDYAAAHWTLAKLRRYNAADNHVDRLFEQVRMRNEHDSSLPYLFSALFKELDDIGETNDAWQALVRGSLTWRRTVDFDLRRDTDGLAGLARAFPCPGPVQNPEQLDSCTPIFIVGLPRSGTTLIERLLGGHTDVHAGGELDDMSAAVVHASGSNRYFDVPDEATSLQLARADHATIAQRYLRNTSWRSGQRTHYTDKRPNNFMHVASIARAMPRAKIIHVHKQPIDGCFSLLKEFFGGRYNYSYRLNELAAYHDGYRQLMQHWRSSGFQFLDVSYEKFVQEPEGEARRILAYCGLDWQEQCLQTDRAGGAIGSASVVQAREPVSTRYVASWKKYESQLEPLRIMLGNA